MKQKTSALARFEATITNEKTKFVIQNSTEAYRTTDGTSRRKTHNLRLDIDAGTLWWENESSKEFTHQFESPGAAQQWWNNMVLSRAAKTHAAANEMDI